MPTYLYAHDGEPCSLGPEFEWVQSIKDDRFSACPQCGRPVQRLVPRSVCIVTTRSNAELRDRGFTKLVRRDSGVYENVTPRDGEARIIDANVPGGIPGDD